MPLSVGRGPAPDAGLLVFTKSEFRLTEPIEFQLTAQGVTFTGSLRLELPPQPAKEA